MGGSGESEAMAANISEALMTTATGLVIAIPASLFYFYFKNNFAETLSVLGQYMGKLLNAPAHRARIRQHHPRRSHRDLI